MKVGLEKIKRVSVVEATVSYIKKQIADGALKPGQQLPSERTLQELLGVSRFTLREALARLSALGIVEITHGKGAFIAQEMNSSSLEDVFFPLFANQSVQNLIDFFEARMLIESEAVRLCAKRRSRKDLDALKEILDRSEAALEDPLKFGELDFLFHNKVSQAAGNIFIDKMMGCLNEYIKKYLLMLSNNPENRKRSLINHRSILEMIEKKDVDNAGRITRKHLNQTFKMLTNFDNGKATPVAPEDLINLFSQ
ncbi:MAG: FadR/GntR family transcriptional regulator [Thermodesulfobacteriota bacterium]